jgi:hypothetical protein
MADSSLRPAEPNPQNPERGSYARYRRRAGRCQREIKSIGDNVKSLKDNMEKNLADVRKIVEDPPKAFAASEQFKKDMEALTDGALKASTERMDDIEKKLNRGRLGTREAKALKHELKVDFDPDKISRGEAERSPR